MKSSYDDAVALTIAELFGRRNAGGNRPPLEYGHEVFPMWGATQPKPRRLLLSPMSAGERSGLSAGSVASTRRVT
jgi:hypothetical protein